MNTTVLWLEGKNLLQIWWMLRGIPSRLKVALYVRMRMNREDGKFFLVSWESSLQEGETIYHRIPQDTVLDDQRIALSCNHWIKNTSQTTIGNFEELSSPKSMKNLIFARIFPPLRY